MRELPFMTSFPRKRESRVLCLYPGGFLIGWTDILKPMIKQFYVYILCNKRNGTLYTGVTSDLLKRVYEHKNNLLDGFTKRYEIHHLVWYEMHETAESAITREKQIKKWNRKWKLDLIEARNPLWKDLYEELTK